MARLKGRNDIQATNKQKFWGDDDCLCDYALHNVEDEHDAANKLGG
jgi:uncharacterized ubiquitin-like protein YukD